MGILKTLLLLIAISMLSFTMMQMAPGDATSALFNPKLTAEDKALIRHQLGLDQPVWRQYTHWLGGIITGDWGVSYTSGQPVITLILQRVGPTLVLSLSALWVTLLLAIPLGIWTAYRAGSWVDQSIATISVIGIALPTFWLGLLLILILSVWLPIFPSSGWMEPGLESAPLFEKLHSILIHMALPLLTMVIASLGSWIRYQRFTSLSILSQPYIQAARARGLPMHRILGLHVLKNTLLPIITLLGLELPGLLSGAFIIEHMFAWPGMGQLGVSAVFARDYPVMMGLLMVSATMMIIGNRLADWGYRLADPRVRA